MQLKRAHYVLGFARAGGLSAEEYLSTVPDPVMAYGSHVAKHMNDDHMESTVAMVEHYVGLSNVKQATITAVDSLGMFVRVAREGEQPFKLRLPFPRKVEDRKDLKGIIVEMTRASAGAPAA
jgi:putative heme iron utilization protein